MKKLLSSIAVLIMATAFAAAKDVVIYSPNGSISILISDTPCLTYEVKADGKTVVAASAFGIDSGKMMSANIGKVGRKSIDNISHETIYKKAEIRDCCNEATLDLKDFKLLVRAYDDGCAWRFISKSKDNFKVYNEKWDVNFPQDAPLWINYSNVISNSIQAQFGSSQENTYSHSKVSDWENGRIAITPLLAEEDGFCVTLAEADAVDYPGLYFTGEKGSQKLSALFPPVPESFKLRGTGATKDIIEEVVSVRDYIADCPAGFEFPWRIVGVNRSAASLLESDMVQRLSRPAAKGDWSWVKPGKVAWDWWCANRLEGVDFESGINTRTYKYFIDFAAQYGLEYVIMDGGWSVRSAADLMQVVPEINLEEIIDYGRQKGVGIILWAGFAPFRNNLEEVCRHYSAMGVKGFKVDFHNRDDQDMMRYYRQAAQTCAEYKLMIEFHGCSKPTGLQRNYPNVVNFEAVFGLEMVKFASKVQHDFVTNEVTMPFVRMYAGPVDYTPGAMHNASMKDFRYNLTSPMSQGTRCRQIALFVSCFAPLQMLCDSPTTYQKETECTEFISRIPVVWDETVALGGKVGEYLAVARRSGDTWYVAAMNGWEAASKEIPLTFLPQGDYVIEEMKDSPESPDSPSSYFHNSLNASAEDILKINIAPGGGYVARISPVE